MYFFTNMIIFDLKYGYLLYAAEKSAGHEISSSLEHRWLRGFQLKLSSDYVSGPEGKKFAIETVIRRRILILDIILGSGLVWYNDVDEIKLWQRAIYTTIGLRMRASNRIVLSANVDYFNNPRFDFDLRSILSLRYQF